MRGNKHLKINLYSIIFSLYLIIVAVVFFYSLAFLKKNIDLVFYPIEEQSIEKNLIGLDLENYGRLETKLGLGKEEIDQPISTTTENVETSTTSTEIILETPASPLKISVVNSTRKSGLAAQLKNKLESSGFKIENISSSLENATTTVILIKPEYENDTDAKEISALVAEEYLVIKKSASETSAYDLEIIIGNK